jgi:hypothetical protein
MTEDISEKLSEECLIDLAESYFGRRVQLDEKRKIIFQYASALQDRETRVKHRKSNLGRLLLSLDNTKAFYRRIGVPADQIDVLLDGVFEADPQLFDSPEVPFRLTLTGRYVAAVRRAYESLQREIELYLRGNGSGEKPGVYYALVKQMVDIYNELVGKQNDGWSPDSVLRFADSLINNNGTGKNGIYNTGLHNTGTSESAATPVSNYADSMNRRLCMETISMNALNVTEYPPLPRKKEVDPVIIHFAESIADTRKSEVRNRLARL